MSEKRMDEIYGKSGYQNKSDGTCIPGETVIENVMLARAYVPFQKLCTLYSPLEGLIKGTIFPELNRPYKSPDKKARPKEMD